MIEEYFPDLPIGYDPDEEPNVTQALAAETTPAPTGDNAAWMTHYALSWAPHLTLLPADAQMAVSYPGDPYNDKKSGDTRTPLWTDYVPLGDPEAIWDKIVKRTAERGNCWIGVAPRLDGLERYQRGGKADMYPIGSLFADIDCSGGNHAAGGLPTREQADEMIKRYPIRPTLKLWTGGGYHVWWSLTELLDITIPQHKDVLIRHKAALIEIAREMNVDFDRGVPGDICRVLRAAGSINGKYGTAVELIDAHPQFVGSIEDFDAELPPLPVSTKPVRRGSAKVIDGVAKEITAPTELDLSTPWGGMRASNLLPRLLEFDGWQPCDSSGGWWDPDPHSASRDAVMYHDPDGVRLFVYSNRMIHEWALDLDSDGTLRDEPRQIDAYEYMLLTRLGGDRSAGGRLASAWMGRWDELFDLIASCDEPEDLLAHVPAPRAKPDLSWEGDLPPETVIDDEGVETEVVPTMTELAKRVSPTDIQVTEDIGMTIGATGSGIWRLVDVEQEDGTKARRRMAITKWAVWRDSVESVYGIDEHGISSPVGKSSYAVRLITDGGWRTTLRGLSAADSLSPAIIASESEAPIAVPYDRRDNAAIADVLRIVGYGTRKRQKRYSTAGWLVEDRAIWLAPLGSVDQHGVVTDVVVGTLAGSEGSLSPAQAALGVREVSTDLRADAEAVSAFIGIAPDHPELGYTLLSALWSSPLPLAHRVAIWLRGDPYTRKSLLLSCLQSFFSGIYPDGSTFAMNLKSSSNTPIGVEKLTTWHRHTLMTVDDFRIDGKSLKDQEKTKGLALGLVHAAYGEGSGDIKGTRDGGSRAGAPSYATVIITSEVTMPGGIGDVSRAIQAHVADTSVIPQWPLEGQTLAPIDHFKRHYALAANRLFGSYIQWLASEIDMIGLDGLRREADATARRLHGELRGDRSGETVAAGLTGWQFAEHWAAAVGIDDIIPSMEEAKSHMSGLVTIGTDAIAAAHPGKVIIDTARSLLEGGQAHLVDPSGDMPTVDAIAQLAGWSNTGRGLGRVADGMKLGVLSMSGTHVLLIDNAVSSIAKRTVNEKPSSSWLTTMMSPHLSEPRRERSDAAEYGAKRPRGYVVPIEMLGLDSFDRAAMTAAEIAAAEAYEAVLEAQEAAKRGGGR